MRYKFNAQSIYQFFSVLLIASLLLAGPGLNGVSSVSAQGAAEPKTTSLGFKEQSVRPAALSVQGDDSLPNLSPYAPDGWSGPIVVSSLKDTVTTGALYEHQDAFIDWAVTNSGGGISNPFTTCLYYDGKQLQCWVKDALASGEAATQMDWVLSIPANPGLHHIELVTDVDQVIPESNEDDNTWGFDFEWLPGTTELQGPGSPLINDTRAAPAHPVGPENSSGSSAPGFYNTSDYMIGNVAVGIIFPESTGNMENWSTARRDAVVSKIQSGLNWWAQQASLNGVNLSFQYDVRYPVLTTYEPISLSSSQDGLWIDQVMTNMGYSGSNYWEKTRAYVNALRAQKSANWAFTYFVVDSLNDSDGRFSDGYFGYTYLGETFVIMTYDNDGWGIANMDRVAAHEMGHVFGAGDNYYQAGYGGCTSTTDPYGYLGIPNSNCAYQNPGAQTNVIMNNNTWNLHWSTAQQIGWRDSNSNGRMDPVDTAPGIKMNVYAPDPTSNTQLSFTGYAYDDPYPHHPCCTNVDLTINTIYSVQYRVDAGDWVNVNASDGAFNTDFEQFTFITPVLSNGTHTIEVKAQNSVGSLNDSYWSDTITVQGNTPAFNKSSPLSGATAQPTSLTLDWGDSTGATSYAYCYDTTDDNACANWISTGTTSQASLSGLSYSTTYYWQVRAKNSNGIIYADDSSTAYWRFTTVPSPAFNKIAPAEAAADQPISLTLDWGDSSGATSYAYCYDTTHDNACANWIPTGTTSQVSISGLSYATTYYWQVRANSSGGVTYANGSSTAYWSFRTVASPAFNKKTPANGAVSVSTSPILDWGDSSGVTSYEYCYDTSNDNTCAAWTSAGTNTSVSLSGLPHGTTYYWQVRAVNAGGTTYANANAWWSFTTAVAPPEAFNKNAPLDGSSTPTQVNLSWEPSAGANSYQLCIDSSNDHACSSAFHLTGTSLSLGPLNYSTTYYWQVTAENAGGTTAANNHTWWSFTTDNPLPSIQSMDPEVTTAGGETFLLTVRGSNFIPSSVIHWNAEPVATHYGNASTLTASISKEQISSAGTMPVKVINPAPGGGETAELSFRILAALPLNGDHPASLRPTFDWEDINPASSYTLQVSTVNTFTSSILLVKVPSSTYTLTVDLPKGKMLYWRVRPNYGTTAGPWNFKSLFFFTPNPPLVPGLLLPVSNALTTDTTPRLDWSDVTVPVGTSFDHYQIQVADDAVFNHLIHDKNVAVSEFTPGVDLSANTTYSWRVRAFNTQNQYSTWSLVRTFRTAIAAPILTSPANGEAILSTRPVFDWADAPGAKSYTLQILAASGSLIKSLTTTNSTGVLTTDLPRNVTYYWRVVANGANGPSLWSNSYRFTSGNPPSIPVLRLPASNTLSYAYRPLFDWYDVTVPSGTVLGHYQIQVDTNTVFSGPVVDTETTGSEFRPTENLSSNTTFYWRVRAFNSDGHFSAWSAVRVLKTAPAQPILVSPANFATPSTTRPEFDWEDVPGATAYTLLVSTSSSFGTLLVNKTVTASNVMMLTDLPKNWVLYWKVRAKAANGYSLWSEPWQMKLNVP